MTTGCKWILGVLGVLWMVGAARAQSREITGAILSFGEYDGGMVCQVPAADADATQKIVGTNVRGIDDKIIGALGDFVTKEDAIDCFTIDAQAGTYEYRVPLEPDTRLMVTFLRGNNRHASFYEVDRAPAPRNPTATATGFQDVITDPPHD